MKMVRQTSFFSIFILISLFYYGFCFKNNLILDIVKSYEQPTRVTIFFCDFKDAAHLHKYISINGILSNTFYIEHRPLLYPSQSHQVLFVLDINCKNLESFLQNANEINLFNMPFRWIIYNDTYTNNINETYEQFELMFQNVHMLVDSEITFAMRGGDSNNPNYQIIQAYKIGMDWPMRREHFALWNVDRKLYDIEPDRILSRRRKNLQSYRLKAVLVITNNDTLNHLTDYKHPLIDTVTKVNYVMVQNVIEMINISLSYVTETTWGYRIPNSTQWSGLIGRLTRKEAHIAGTSLFMTSERVPIIQYLSIDTKTNSKFVFRQPKLSFVTNVYRLPFSLNVWIASLILILFAAVTLYFAVQWEKICCGKYDKEEDIYVDGDLNEALFIAIGAVCQQGASALPSRVPGRIVSIMLFLSLMFLYTSYSANIVSLLQSPSKAINTLFDLLNSRLELGVQDTVYNRFYFPAATEPVRKALYEHKIAPPGQISRFMTLEEGIKRMRAGLFAFHFEEGIGYKRIQETFFEHEKCGLKYIQFLQVTNPFMCVQKNLSYLEHFQIAFLRNRETGLIDRETTRLYTKKPSCESHGSAFVSVSLIDCYPLAVIFSIGIVLAIIILLLEMYIKLRAQSWRRFGTRFSNCCKNSIN